MFCFSFNPRCNPSLEWCVTHSKISLLSHPLRRFFCGVLPVFWDKAADDRGPLWDYVFSQVPCIIRPVVDYLIALVGLVWKHSYCRKWNGCIIVESKSLELTSFLFISSRRLHLFEQKYSKNSNIMNELLLQFNKLMQSCIFSIITPVFSVTWSFRNHSNILICCSRKITDYHQCWKRIYFPEFFYEWKVQKNSIYLKS